MSWSFQAIGKVSAVVRAIEESNNRLTDNSLAEWTEAKPALLALVGANVGAVKVNASGHASFEMRPAATGSLIPTERVKTQGQCSVVIEPLYGFIE